MTFTVAFKLQFAQEFTRFPPDQQDRVLDFVQLFEKHGLGDFSKYPGKVAPSWSGLPAGHPNIGYAQANDLWHYHMGYPVFTPGPKYQTSDWLIHFQWVARGTHIELVDCYQHYTYSGAFYMPPAKALASAPAPTQSASSDPSSSAGA